MAEKAEAPFSVSLAKPTEQVNNQKSEITVKQFLDLLKTAYQVHENIEGILVSKGMNDVAEWIRGKNCDQKGDAEQQSQEDTATETARFNARVDEIESQMKVKLNEIISEGIMDSVLPYMIPQPPPPATSKPTSSSTNSSLRKSKSCDRLNHTSTTKKKSSVTVVKPPKTNSEVEIHVCDEVMGTRKDFICNQKLLVEKMGYFAEVSRDQTLDDMEISVHCDIGIFEWLMRWVKKEVEEPGPQLEVNNAIPILISATFLQMEPLIVDCLQFCHQNLNDILKSSNSLSCLNDAILTRLAAMYTNLEIEAIKDRKDKIQSRLYCKMIQSLNELEAETLRGHYCTFARIFRCKFCQQLINPLYATQIPCAPFKMRLQFDGSIINTHVRDPNWDINDYILSLYKAVKSWRKVYWRLWGSCHFLYCTICKRYFPVKQEGWCRFHPDLPQFFTLDTQKPPLPVGRYPCCGERAYRFQILDDRSGCLFRDHTLSHSPDIKETATLQVLEAMRSYIVEEPPKLVFPDRLTRLIAREPTDPNDSKLESKEIFWWEGIEIIPPRPKLGLLNSQDNHQQDQVNEDASFETSDSDDESSSSVNTSSSNTADSEESAGIKKKVVNQKTKRKKAGKRFGARSKNSGKNWQGHLSTRSNQDLQRLNEETAFKKMAQILNDRTKLLTEIEGNKMSSKQKPGGVWVRLEAEWKEKNMPGINQNKKSNIYSGRARMKTKNVL